MGLPLSVSYVVPSAFKRIAPSSPSTRSAPRTGETEAHGFYGQRNGFAEMSDPFPRLYQIHTSRRGLCHDLLARHCAAASLEHAQGFIDFIGAVGEIVDPLDSPHVPYQQAEGARQLLRCPAGGDAVKFQPFLGGATRKSMDGLGRGTPCPQTNGHVVANILHGCARQGVHVRHHVIQRRSSDWKVGVRRVRL